MEQRHERCDCGGITRVTEEKKEMLLPLMTGEMEKTTVTLKTKWCEGCGFDEEIIED